MFSSLTIVSLLAAVTSSVSNSDIAHPTSKSATTALSAITPPKAGGLYAGLLVGSPAGIDLSWHFHESLQWTTALGWQNDDRGAWMGTSDLLLLFPEAIGSVGSAGRLVLFTGLGAQVDYRHYEDTSVRYGSRVSFGLKYVFDEGRYEAFTSVASGLYYKPRVRASLNTNFGLRIKL